MAEGRLPKVLVLIALAWMAFAENQIAVPAEMGYRPIYAIEHNRGVQVGTTPVMGRDEVIGWAAHPLAAIILIALAAAFVLNVNLGRVWGRWRYWIAFAGLIVCLVPSPGQTLFLSIPALILVTIAAVAGKPKAAVG